LGVRKRVVGQGGPIPPHANTGAGITSSRWSCSRRPLQSRMASVTPPRQHTRHTRVRLRDLLMHSGASTAGVLNATAAVAERLGSALPQAMQ
jgi:hypothetical protein